MEGGLREDPWKEKLRRLIREFVARKKGIEAVYLFGSRAWGRPGYASDFELAVKGESQCIRELSAYLEESTFPFEVEVAAWNELPEEWREKIEKEGERWI